jgi:hypothetical protein
MIWVIDEDVVIWFAEYTAPKGNAKWKGRGYYLDAKLAVHHTLHRISHRLEQEAKDKKQAATNSDRLFHPPLLERN